jgi:hypothetical protein
VGQYTDPAGATHGLLRQPNGAITTIDVPGPSGFTIAVRINDHGLIVGAYTRTDTGSSQGNAHRWRGWPLRHTGM